MSQNFSAIPTPNGFKLVTVITSNFYNIATHHHNPRFHVGYSTQQAELDYPVILCQLTVPDVA